MTQHRDFTEELDSVAFTIAPDTFQAVPALAGGVLAQFAGRFSGVEDASADQVPGIVLEALSLVLYPEDHARFSSRFNGVSGPPIQLDQAESVLVWLIEVYTGRPTQQPSHSSDGSPLQEPGTPPTVPPQPPVSIPLPSLPVAS